MFTEAKSLLVVYKEKDEVILNQLKKLVESKDDDVEGGKIVGTEDGTVAIVSWSEKVWLENKKAGNLEDKILFIGDVKGTDKLAPVIDIKFEKHGVSYGFAGNQALLSIDPKVISKKENYEEFLKDLRKVSNSKIAKSQRKFDSQGKKFGVAAGMILVPAIFGLGVVGEGLIAKSVFNDASLVRQQMLLYGIIELYLNDLDAFVKA
jgi:hypothetical protein